MNRLVINDKWYKILVYMSQVGIPAIATLYFSLSTIWGLPYGEQILGTFTALDTFLGTMLRISSKNYGRLTDEERKRNER